MRFKSGWFGACVAVLAVILTVLAGYTGAVEKEQVASYSYSYLTDASGLFDYSNVPEYVDYSPNLNYTGYSAIGGGDLGVSFTQASTLTPYKYVIQPGTTRTASATLTYTDRFSSYYDNAPSSTAKELYRVGTYGGNWYNFGNGAADTGLGGSTTGNWISNNVAGASTVYPSVIKLSTLLNKWLADVDMSAGYDEITIDLDYPGSTEGRGPVLFYAGDWKTYNVYVGVPINTTKTIYAAGVQGNTANPPIKENECLPNHLSFNPASMIVTATLDRLNYQNNPVTVFEAPADQVAVVYNYQWRGGTVTGDNAWNNARAYVNATITGTTYPTYGSMDPEKGVSLNGTAVWANGYENETVTFKVLPALGSRADFRIQVPSYSPIRLEILANGQGDLYIDGYTNLGIWPAYQFTINGPEQFVDVTPTLNTSLTSVEPTGAATLRFDLDTIEPSTIHRFTLSGTIPGGFQVTGTTVFLDTFNTVMRDPSLNPLVYFPDLEEYRINLYSFATYGDSLTLNGQTMEVNRQAGTFTFTDSGGIIRTKILNDLAVNYIKNDANEDVVTLTVGFETFDLGPLTDRTLRFGGLWYFTTGIYKAADTVEEVYNWNLDGGFHASAGQCLVIFLGVLGAGAVIGHRFGHVGITTLDWVIIALVGFGGLVYLGGMVI